jgi:mercuric reductase
MNRRKVDAAVLRLGTILPLQRSRDTLAPPLRGRYRDFLAGWYREGAPPPLAPSDAAELASAGLLVLDGKGAVSGAYPFTTEDREHAVETPRSTLRCMCSIDALAVSTMFEDPLTVRSRCRVNDTEIVLAQRGLRVERIAPDDEVYAAIDWSAADPERVCAASLCTEMVFLAGQRVAIDWEAGSPESRQVFDVDEAAAFAAAFFGPL